MILFKRIVAVALSSVLMAPTLAHAQPSVNSVPPEVSEGGTYTVSGSGFGSVPSSALIKWETFDDGSDGALLNQTGYWEVQSDNPNQDKPQFSNEHLRTGAGLNAKIILQRPENYSRDIFLKRGLNFGEKVLISFWVRYDYGIPDNGHQVKLWRVCQGASGDTYPSFSYYDGGALSDGTVQHWPRYNVSAGDGSSKGYSIAKPAQGEWSRVLVELYTGTVGGQDASFKVWHNGQLAAEKTGVKLLMNSSDKMDAVWFGEYVGNIDPAQAVQYFDDVYLSRSWARVEIGNNAEYSACTRREIQVPVSWSQDSIQFVANRGGFLPGEPLYLFVVDPDGRISTSGRPINFSSEGMEGPGAPGQPILAENN